MEQIRNLVILLFVSLIVLGCSNGTSPVMPDENPGTDQEITSATGDNTQSRIQSQSQIWGYYDIHLDLESKSVEITPNRSVEFTANVVLFLNSNPTGLQIAFNGVTPDPAYYDVDLDVTINHPLNTEGFDGYDVRGLFVGEGSGVLEYDSDLGYPVHGVDQVLMNADGYSRWFNPTDFTAPGIFGYLPGNLASPGYTGSGTMNGYKYFGEGLGATDSLFTYLISGDPQVGYFLHGTGNTRNYVIRFPVPLPGLDYGYAVIANWSGTDPGSHPSHAPEAVGVGLADNSTLYYEDEMTNGGDLNMDIVVCEWDAELTGGVMLDYDIYLESTVLLSDYKLNTSEMIPIDSGDIWQKFHVNIPADNVLTTSGNELWVIVEDSYVDYTNPLGVPNEADDDPLAACFRFDLDVASVMPKWITVTSPNGGENWGIGTSQEITWDASSNIPSVTIDLSLDSGENYTWDVITATPNDGSFMWDDIPAGAVGAMNRIRISATSDPGISDESDADFAVSGDWIRVEDPNGGEAWVADSVQEIVWDASELTGTVNIEYSKDNFVSDINVIASNTPNDASFIWVVPYDPSSTVRVRIFSPDPLAMDVSDNDFSIVVPPQYIHVLSPDGGEEWGIGSNQLITWDSAGVAGNVNIIYSHDNFVSHISTVASDIPNSHSFIWNDIPDDPNTTSRIKIESVTDPLIFDVSNADFSIIETGWARTWGVDYDDSARGITSDPEGNIYVTGQTNYDNPTGLSYIRKYDSAGTLIWSRTWGSEGSVWAYGIARDAVGNLYVAGGFRGTDVDFEPGSGSDLHTSDSGGDCFLSSFDSDGNFIWARTWGGVAASYIDGCAGAGVIGTNVYAAGWFTGTDTDFDPGPGTDLHTAIGSHDGFLTCFDTTTGDFVWAGTWGSTGFDGARGMAVDDSRIFVTGGFAGTVDFDPDAGGIDEHTAIGSSDAYLTWFSDSNVHLGAHNWGAPGEWISSWPVAVDGLGNIYVGGEFGCVDMDFDPGIGTDLRSTNGEDDAFVSCFNSLVEYQWVRTWGGAEWEGCYAIAADPSGYVTVAGYFRLDCDFDPGPGIDEKTSNGSTDAFLSTFDNLGNYIRAHTWGGTTWDGCYSAHADDMGNLYVGGYFTTTGVEFAPFGFPCNDDSDLHDAYHDDDAFLIKYLPDGCW